MTTTFAYWTARGLAHPIRLILTYAGENFNEKSYIPKGTHPNIDRSDWLKEKFTLNLDFPNLPYYIDGNLRLSQSSAILRYLARKYHLNGTSEEEWTRIDLLESQLYDLRDAFFNTCNKPDFENAKVEYLKNLSDSMKQLSAFLGQKKFFAGDKLTYVDFLAYEYLYQQQLFQPGVFDDHPNLKQFYERFEALPPLVNYIKTAEASKYPPNMKMKQILQERELSGK